MRWHSYSLILISAGVFTGMVGCILMMVNLFPAISLFVLFGGIVMFEIGFCMATYYERLKELSEEK